MSGMSIDDQLYAGILDGSLTHANIVFSVPVLGISGTVLVAGADTRPYFEPGAVLRRAFGEVAGAGTRARERESPSAPLDQAMDLVEQRGAAG
jgi:hypothetical protein